MISLNSEIHSTQATTLKHFDEAVVGAAVV